MKQNSRFFIWKNDVVRLHHSHASLHMAYVQGFWWHGTNVLYPIWRWASWSRLDGYNIIWEIQFPLLTRGLKCCPDIVQAIGKFHFWNQLFWCLHWWWRKVFLYHESHTLTSSFGITRLMALSSIPSMQMGHHRNRLAWSLAHTMLLQAPEKEDDLNPTHGLSTYFHWHVTCYWLYLYHEMWPSHIHFMPLADCLCIKTDNSSDGLMKRDNAFYKMKLLVAADTLSSFPNHSKWFDIYTYSA